MRTRDEVLREFGALVAESETTEAEKDMASRIAQQEARIRELEAENKRMRAAISVAAQRIVEEQAHSPAEIGDVYGQPEVDRE